MEKRQDPVQPADAAALQLAHSLLQARHASLSYLDSQGHPAVSRIGFGLCPSGLPLTLISSLSAHFQGLAIDARCAVMLGEPGEKGDPLTHPRLMVQASAVFVANDDPARASLRDHWLKGHPKAALYVDFADFAFVRLMPASGLLNGGFGRAFRLSAAEMRP
jgi:heme iron utilization protein